MMIQRIDVIQDKLDYQREHPEEQIDFKDTDNNGVTAEVVHVQGKEQPIEVTEKVSLFKFHR